MGGGSRGSAGGKLTGSSQRGWSGETKHRGKTQIKDRWAQEAGLPRDRKLQVSQKDFRKSRMWAAGKARPHPEGGALQKTNQAAGSDWMEQGRDRMGRRATGSPLVPMRPLLNPSIPLTLQGLGSCQYS